MSYLAAALLFGILVFIHELGHFLAAKLCGVKVLKFSLGFGPKLIGKQVGDTEYLVSALPLGGYVKMAGEETDETVSPEDEARSFKAQSLLKKAFIVVAGPISNILLTYVVFTGLLMVGQPVIVPDLANIQPVIDTVEEGYPAAAAGLKAGDRIVKIGDYDIETWFDVLAVVNKNPGKEMLFVVERDKKPFSTNITPRTIEDKDQQGNTVTFGRVGIRKHGKGLFSMIESTPGPAAFVDAAKATYKMGVLVFDTIEMLVSGTLSLKNLSGPVGILSESQKAASAGLLTYLSFLALISVNLGILNLLPIPVLDGGHLLFMTIETITGRPLSERVVGIAQRIGIAFLIGLMLIALYNDSIRLFFKKAVPY